MKRPHWTPAYAVRESARARRVILRVFPERRLEVVIPRGFDRKAVPGIVDERKDWIQQAFRELEEKGYSAEATSALPESIYLNAVDEHFEIHYTDLNIERLELDASDEGRLKVFGDVNDLDRCRSLLKLWLRRQGRLHLPLWLEKVSLQTGLQFKKVQVRNQKSRWGSCSQKGTISLNQNLLFLPPESVRYIMIHELCHTVQLNHSQRFWSLVARLEPNFKVLDSEMNTAHVHVPLWAR